MDHRLLAVTSGSAAKGSAKGLKVVGPGLVHYHVSSSPLFPSMCSSQCCTTISNKLCNNLLEIVSSYAPLNLSYMHIMYSSGYSVCSSFNGIDFTVISVSVNALVTYSPVSVPPTQPAISAQHTSKLISSFVNMSMPLTMPPASSAEVPLASMAGVLLTRIHTASLIRYSSADGILLLCEFVGRRQDCLYSVTVCIGLV